MRSAASFLALLLATGFVPLQIHAAPGPPLLLVPPTFAPPSVQHNWGPYTPGFSLAPYSAPPSRCTITQVNILQRHGARFPTSGSGKSIQAVVKKLQSASQFTDPRLNFLKNFTYSLGTDSLIPFGASQSLQTGMQAFQRYRALVPKTNIPFVRASSSQRVVDSATNWTAGFSQASRQSVAPTLNVILLESLNDTLHNLCTNIGTSDPQTDTWTSIYGPPIAARLNSQAIGANITATDISNLIPLCAFETLVNEALSPFCALFTPSEFGQFEYFADLDKFYGTGYGQPLGPVEGVGYINELIARLTNSPVQDETQANKTLDSSPATFPLNRTLYADFTHDNQMAAIFSALGLFKQPQPLDPTSPDPNRTWVASRLTPFSSRLVIERLSCSSGHQTHGKDEDTFVRMLINDAIAPLSFCGSDGDGLCTLEAFIDSQSFARNNGDGDFEKCWN